jgi:hypothetical protein
MVYPRPILSEDARSGQRIARVLALAVLIPNALLFAFALTFGLPPGRYTIRLGIGLVMGVMLWRGYGWARSYLAFALGLSSIVALVGGLLIGFRLPLLGVLGFLLAPLYGWGAWALWSSPKVEAYIEYREQRRNPDMSFSARERV